MRNIYTVLLVMAFGAIHAQNITSYRYWYNDDMSNITTLSVSPAEVAELTAELPATDLEPGFHRITMQFNDGSDWSAPLTKVFKKSGAHITGYRYWLNNDPGAATNVSINPESDLQLSTSLSNVSTDRDFNFVTIQFVDADGAYSAPLTKCYVKGIGLVNGYEYWIDDNIDARISGSIQGTEVANLIADLSTNTLSGDHFFTIRFKGDPDGWSVPLTTGFSFYTSVEELQGITDVIVFPNPTTEHIGVRLTTHNARQLEISVIDTKGAVVAEFPTWNVSGSAHQNWSVAHLVSGRYFIRLSDETHSWTVPFVKY